MNMNSNAAKCDLIVRRNLPSFLGLTMGVLMLMTMPAPSAHAVLQTLTMFDFENAAARTAFNAGSPPTPYPADAGQAGVFLSSGPDPPFQPGQIVMEPTGGNPNGVLDLMGNNSTSDPELCFSLGAIDTTALTQTTLSFDLKSVGGGSQFSTLTLLYSTTAGGGAGTFTSFTTISPLNTGNFSTYKTLSFTDGAFDNQSTLYFEFCFSGATNSSGNDHTFVDNITVTAVPEPSSYIGGLLGIVGLCWYQRRSLMRFLSSRPA